MNFAKRIEKFFLTIPQQGKLSIESAEKYFIENPFFLKEIRLLAAPLPESNEPYSRRLIFSSSIGEVMIAHWPSGAMCFPHDHGGSSGVVSVLEGSFFERSFVLNHFPSQVELGPIGPEVKYETGSLIPVSPGDIHHMRTPTGGITLHIYTPAIQGMKVYDEVKRCIYTVHNNCGAWVPLDERLIIRRESFDSYLIHDQVS